MLWSRTVDTWSDGCPGRGEHLPELAREELARVVALDVADDFDGAVGPRGLHIACIDLRLAKNSSALASAYDFFFSSLTNLNLE